MSVHRALRAAVLVALAALAAPAAAQDKPKAPPPTAEQAADDLLAAFKEKDAAKLKAAAELSRPDSWIVADLLVARGQADAAEALAKAAPPKDVEKLPAYIASRKGKADDAKAREALAAANAAIKAGNGAEALEIVDAVAPKGTDVVSVLLLHARGAALRASNLQAESAAAYLAAGEAAERLGWLNRAAEAYYERGISGMRLGDWRITAQSWERRLAMEERREKKKSIADALGNVGAAWMRVGEFDKAIDAMERSLKMNEELHDDRTNATILTNIAAVHTERGDYPKALEFSARALVLQEKAGAEKDLQITLMNLALTHMYLGNGPKAIECAERARALAEKLGNQQGVASAEAAIGRVLITVGDYKRAIEHFNRALPVFESGGARGDAAEVLSSMGAAYLGMSEYARGLGFQERALEVFQQLGDQKSIADTLTNIGATHGDLGDKPRSIEFAQKALAMYEKLGNGIGIVNSLLNIGAGYMYVDDAKALQYLERSRKKAEEIGFRAGMSKAMANIATLKRTGGDAEEGLAASQAALVQAQAAGDRDTAVRLLGQIGAAYQTMGDQTRALEYSRRALAQAEELGLQDVVVGMLTNISLQQLQQSDNAGALASARRAVAETSLLVRGVGDEQTTVAREKWELGFIAGAAAAANLNDASAATYFVESSRAGSLLESLRGRDALLAVAIPEALRKDEAKAREAESAALANLRTALTAKKVADIAAARKALTASRDALRDVIGRIQREAKAGAGLLYPEADSLETIRSRLREDEVLVLYSRMSWDKMGAVVIAKSGARFVGLGLTKDIETACGLLTADDPAEDTGSSVAELRALAVDPLGLDDKIKRVLVSPWGALSYVPFALLLDDRDVAYVPSGTTYGLLLADRDKRGESVLALGDPDYTGRVGSSSAVAMRGGMTLTPLPASGLEAKAVGDLVLTGKDASEAGLRAALTKKPRWRGVHLACHGLVDPERPTLSALALSAGGDDDGLLSALEVFQLKTPADLVVLSACETGRGKVYKTEGIVGLTRAFMFAGAPRVVVSLWKVDDEATSALMKKFYEGWKKGVPAARALREAQAFVRSQEKWQHPYYWAAWTLWGLPD